MVVMEMNVMGTPCKEQLLHEPVPLLQLCNARGTLCILAIYDQAPVLLKAFRPCRRNI